MITDLFKHMQNPPKASAQLKTTTNNGYKFPRRGNEKYLSHWDYFFTDSLIGKPNTNTMFFSGLLLELFSGSGSNNELIGRALIIIALFIDYLFLCIGSIAFPLVTCFNAAEACRNIFKGQNLLRAFTTLALIATVITACIYLAPIMIASLTGYGVMQGLATATGILCTIGLGNLALSAESAVRGLICPQQESSSSAYHAEARGKTSGDKMGKWRAANVRRPLKIQHHQRTHENQAVHHQRTHKSKLVDTARSRGVTA